MLRVRPPLLAEGALQALCSCGERLVISTKAVAGRPSSGPHFLPKKLRAGTNLLMPSTCKHTVLSKVLKLWRQHNLLCLHAYTQVPPATLLVVQVVRCAFLLGQPLQCAAWEQYMGAQNFVQGAFSQRPRQPNKACNTLISLKSTSVSVLGH